MIRRFFTRILMVILIGACGYNAVQTYHLQQDVHRLEASLKTHRMHVTAAPIETDNSWLGKANARAQRAGDDLVRGDMVGAQQELSRGGSDIAQAARENPWQMRQDIRALQHLQQQLVAMQAQAQSAGVKAGPDVKRVRAQILALRVQLEALTTRG